MSIFIYVSKETDLLQKTIDIICFECSPIDLEVIYLFYKDNQSNESLSVARELIRKYPEFQIKIHFQASPNIYCAVYESFIMANSSHTIFMASDLETNPHAVKIFIESAKKKPSAITTASRWIKGSQVENYSFIKKAGTRILRCYFSILFKTNITDLSFQYLIYPMSLFRKLNFYNAETFIWECIIKPLRIGIEIIEVPIEWYGSNKKSSFSYTDLIKRGLILLYLGIKIRITPIKKIIKKKYYE